MTVNIPLPQPRFPQMARPSFSLTDDQARLLASRVAALQGTYPYDSRNHRPFVRGFLRAVQEATGQLYSPAIYQRLLAAFAPERRPSTATLAAEKQALALEDVFHPEQGAGNATESVQQPAVSPTQLHAIVSDAVDAALVRSARFGAVGSSQVDFYAAKLRDTEQELLAVRAQAAQLAAELMAARQAVSSLEQETERMRAVVAQQANAVEKMGSEITDHRKFAMQAIEESRGETRVWKERCVILEGQRKMDAQLLETFRQKAYRAGATIPEELLQNKPR
jgi:hypothetical protein